MVSTFANYGRSSILFGVADDGRAVGLADPVASCLGIESQVNDVIELPPISWARRWKSKKWEEVYGGVSLRRGRRPQSHVRPECPLVYPDEEARGGATQGVSKGPHRQWAM